MMNSVSGTKYQYPPYTIQSRSPSLLRLVSQRSHSRRTEHVQSPTIGVHDSQRDGTKYDDVQSILPPAYCLSIAAFDDDVVGLDDVPQHVQVVDGDVLSVDYEPHLEQTAEQVTQGGLPMHSSCYFLWLQICRLLRSLISLQPEGSHDPDDEVPGHQLR